MVHYFVGYVEFFAIFMHMIILAFI